MSESIPLPPEQPIYGRLPDGGTARLRLHPDLSAVPGWETDEEFAQLCASIGSEGIITPLLVHLTGEMDSDSGAEWADIYDGRHRFTAYKLTEGWQRGPVPCAETDRPVGEIIVRTLVERRHVGPGLRAYLAWPILATVFEVAVAGSRKRQGKKKVQSHGATEVAGEGTTPESSPEEALTIRALAQTYGLSYDSLNRARKIHDHYAARPFLKTLHEPRILSGELALEHVLSTFGGKIETERSEEDILNGTKKRATPTPATQLNRSVKDWGHRFTKDKWQAVEETERPALLTKIVGGVLQWPDEVLASLRLALLAEGGQP